METYEREILHRAKVQKRNALIIRWTLRFFTVVSVIGVMIGFVVLLFSVGRGFMKEDTSYTGWIILLIVYVAFFILPFLLSMPLVLPLALTNLNIDRIVVFRKFNNRTSGRALRRIIRQVISHYGHVFTLSDSRFKIKWYVRIPVLLGQASFFHFRPRNIRNDRTLAGLESKLKNRGWLNINWLLSSGKVFSVRTTDGYWQATAKLLLRDCRLVIIDITYRTEALEWEAETTKAVGLERSIILIASDQDQEATKEWQKKYDSPDDYRIPLFYYNDRGRFADKQGFGLAIAQILAHTVIPARENYSTSFIKKALFTSGLVLGAALLLLFLLSPYLMPVTVGKYSPFPGQAIFAFLQANVDERDKADISQIEQRIRTHWPLQGAAQSISYAWHHETAECPGVIRTLESLAQPAEKSAYLKLAAEGEPVMADVAAWIIKDLHLADRDELALQLMALDRVDRKEGALDLLNDSLPGLPFIDRLMDQLAAPSFKVVDAPFQHEVRDGFNVVIPPTPDDLEMYRLHFYFDLYRLLQQCPGTRVPDHINSLREKNINRDVRIVFSLLLLDTGDGSQLPTLFDPYFIDKWYPAAIKNKGEHYFFSSVPQPFQELVDSTFLKKSGLRLLPSFDTLVAHVSGSDLTESYLYFLLENYPKANVDVLAATMPPAKLSKALYRYLEEDESGRQARILPIVNEHQKNMEVLLTDTAMGLEDRLKVAWLLAHIGDETVVGFAKEASKQGFVFLFYHPIEDFSDEVLAIYQRHRKRNVR